MTNNQHTKTPHHTAGEGGACGPVTEIIFCICIIFDLSFTFITIAMIQRCFCSFASARLRIGSYQFALVEDDSVQYTVAQDKELVKTILKSFWASKMPLGLCFCFMFSFAPVGWFACLFVCLLVCLLVGLLVCWFVCLFVCCFDVLMCVCCFIAVFNVFVCFLLVMVSCVL